MKFLRALRDSAVNALSVPSVSPDAELSHSDQPEALLPAAAHERDERVRLTRIVERGDGFAPRVFHDLVIAYEVADAERWHARLPRAEEVTGTAKLEIPFRDL